MGHDIDVGPAESLYISFNWSPLQHIFHIDQIHGHDNRDGRISRRLKEALATLADMGYTPSDEDLPVDGWGQPQRLDVGVAVQWMEDEHPLSGVIVAKRANEFRIQVARHSPKRSYAQVAAAASARVPQFVTVKAEKLALKFDIKCPACYRMFANIVNYFLEVAEKYPHETWYSDQVFGCQPLYGVEGVNNPDE